MGDSMSQPIQLGSGMSKGGPSSDVIVKVSRKKPKKIKKINEGILSSIGSFSKGVAQGIQDVQRGQFPTFSAKQDKKEQKKPSQVPELGKTMYVSKKDNIKAVVVSKINMNGEYKVRLIGNTITDPSPYKFFKTKKYPDGVIASPNKIDPSDTILNKSDVFPIGPNTKIRIISGL